jgi:hypothetical protein
MTTGSLVSNEVRAIVNRMADSYEKIKWVACPVCEEDWTKLMPVQFFQESEGRPIKRICYTCPPCATSVKSCSWFASHYGILFDTKAEIRTLPAFFNLDRETQDHNGLYIRLYDGTRIVPRGGGVDVYREGEDKRSFESIPAAMIFISTGERKIKEEPSWSR